MSNKSRREQFSKKQFTAVFALGLVVACGIGFAAGWLSKANANAATSSRALRLGGDQYQFIDPLLACNLSNSSPAQEDTDLAAAIKQVIDAHIKAGDISKASVFFADITAGKWADVNPDQKYFPSSLGKIPIMLAYYQLAETKSGVLDKEIFYPSGQADDNLMQDIPPADAIVPGKSYTVATLIGYMIKYSDNNAARLLYQNIDKDVLNSVYADLNIPVNEEPSLDNLDFISAHQIGTLFRVLYNATFLTRSDSEAALKLLSQSSFTQGIVAGVGSSTAVSHKLGLVGIAPDNTVTTEHELHDCGIVYGKDTYHLCVMTRGAGNLAALEKTIADISKVVYNKVGKNAQ